MKVVCIVSGGIDSVSVAANWQKKGYDVHAITFLYGQKATREVSRAKMILEKIGIEDHRFIDISFMNELYGESNSLTSSNVLVADEFNPNLVVPLRNMIFITIASAWAFSIDAEKILYGAHASDKPYPDCRPRFAKELEPVINLGESDSINEMKRRPLSIWSPAIEGLDKKDLIKLGYSALGDLIFETWSCYLDGFEQQCGTCESCHNRKKAFELAGIEDKTKYK